ncbi:MAG: TIGR00730 family Rossman fold protein [Pseudomonadota bacterium]
MASLRSVCVYCASSSRGPESHKTAATALGKLLAENNIRLVFGGGHVGLMGVIADAALAAGGEVTGVIPKFLQDMELAHEGCDELIVTDSMHARKRRMAELSDAFVILPGGLGTLDEAFEIVTWRQVALHDKPIVVADLDGYWRPLRTMLEQIVDNHYMHGNIDTLLTFVESVDEILPALAAEPAAQTPIETKWL